MTSDELPGSWKIGAIAASWLVYLPLAAILWSKPHLPLILAAIPLAVMFVFLGVALVIVRFRAAHLSHVETYQLVLTHYLVVILALTVFSVAEWAFGSASCAALTTGLTSMTVFVIVRLRRLRAPSIARPPGRQLLEFRRWTFAEVCVLFVTYALALVLSQR